MALAPRADEAPVPTSRVVFMFVRYLAAAGVLILAFWAVIGWLKAHQAGPGAIMAAAAVYFILVLGMVWLRSRGRTVRSLMSPSPAARRFRKRQLIATVVYMAALLVALAARLQFHVTGGPLAYVLALLVAAPVVGMMGSKALYLREETDEVMRAIQVESSMWALAGVMSVATVWGFLELLASAPHIQLWLLFPAWAIFLCVANIVVGRRYR